MNKSIKDLIKDSKTVALFAGKTISIAEKQLHNNEHPLFAGSFSVGSHSILVKPRSDSIPLESEKQSILVLTDSRLFYVNHALGMNSIGEIPLQQIKSIEKIGCTFEASRYYVKGTRSTFSVYGRNVSLKLLESKLLEAQETHQNNITHSAKAHTAADEILKFKRLMDAGVISPEEFEAKKKQLLSL